MKDCDKCKIKGECRYYYPCEIVGKEHIQADALKSIEERAEKYASLYQEDMRHFIEEWYTQGATEQKSIDDEQYRKDMRYVGIKREELIEKACKWTCSKCPLRCKQTLTSGYVACAKYIDRNECESLQSLIKAKEE